MCDMHLLPELKSLKKQVTQRNNNYVNTWNSRSNIVLELTFNWHSRISRTWFQDHSTLTEIRKKLKMEESNSTYCQNSFLNYTTLHQVVNHSEFVGCLQETILHYLPPAVLLLFGVFEFSRYFSSKNVNRNIPCNRLNVSKLVFTGILILIHLCEIVFFYTGKIQRLHTTSDTTFIEQEFIFTASYIFSIVLLLVSIKYGIRTSPSQFLFYLVSVICGAAYFQSVVDSSSVILGLFCAHFVPT